jgi:hypothetical protein
MVEIPKKIEDKELPIPELSPQEQQIRASLLQQAILQETAQGKDALKNTVGETMQTLRQMEVIAAAVESNHLHAPPTNKSKDTPLLAELLERVKISPIPVNEYMSQVLTHPQHGYYMSRDVFGTKGDFITAPEVSQLFGELIGVWVVWMWQALGSPQKVQLVELGPGRGTMMSDMLRTISQFRPLVTAMSVDMVEASPALREVQRAKLSRCLHIHTHAHMHMLYTLNKKMVSRPIMGLHTYEMTCMRIYTYAYGAAYIRNDMYAHTYICIWGCIHTK